MLKTGFRSCRINRINVARQLPRFTAPLLKSYTLPQRFLLPSSPKKLYTTASSMGQHYKPTIDADVVKVFVLETDKPHPATENERGSFGEILHEHFSKAGSTHHPPLGVETEQVFVVTEQGGRMPTAEEFEGYDGLLITGSMYDAHGDNPWIHELLALLKREYYTLFFIDLY